MSRQPPALIIKRDATGQALYAARTYRPGDTVVDFSEVEWRPERDRYTVQHPCGGHIYNRVLAKVSHSCDPNCEVVFPGRALVAIRAIEPGQAITFDYRRTESRFAHPFDCLCGSPRCRGHIG